MILGTISAVDNSNGLQLTIDGEDAPTTKKYTYMASYVPAANDRVLIEKVGGSYVVMGKIIDDYTKSGVVREAATAVTANSAASADSALTANSADVSDKTKGFDSSVSSENGKLVTYVSREYNSDLGKYIVTDVQTTYSNRNFVYK